MRRGPDPRQQPSRLSPIALFSDIVIVLLLQHVPLLRLLFGADLVAAVSLLGVRNVSDGLCGRERSAVAGAVLAAHVALSVLLDATSLCLVCRRLKVPTVNVVICWHGSSDGTDANESDHCRGGQLCFRWSNDDGRFFFGSMHRVAVP